jgi:nucleoside phosphorylase
MYKEIKEEELFKSHETHLLIVTATDLETEILHNQLKSIPGEEKLLVAHHEVRTYYKGVFGEYICIHVQCDTMGSIGVASSIITVREAIRLIKPKATIMIGIAFGIDDKEQKIGDVLVANSIIPYDFKKVASGKTSVRAQSVPTSSLLINKFKNARGWEHILDSGKARKIIAPVFSGEELINDINRRIELEKFNEHAKGGEMEGAGLYAAADGLTEWILVKGICDFADGNKDLNKEENQKTAMQSATSLCLEVFSSGEAFKSIGLLPCCEEILLDLSVSKNPSQINKILFDTYASDKEEYYIERKIDELILNCLKFQSIWVHGKSGRGKSISVLRNIIQSSYQSISVSLANCVGFGIDEFFNEIYIELVSYLEPESKINVSQNHQEAVRQINLLLEKHFPNKTIFILIDEIPLGNDDSFKIFTQRIFSLFISSSLVNKNVNIKYVLSSIYSPEENIEVFQQQIRSLIRFVEFEDWTKDELTLLLALIEKELNLSLDGLIKENLIRFSKGSPRWIKKFFKNIFILGEITTSNVENAIIQTNYEITV